MKAIRFQTGLAIIASIFLAAFFIYPLINVIGKSFWIGGHFSSANISLGLLDSSQVDAFLNSCVIGVVVAMGCAVLGLLTGYGLFRFKFFGKSVAEVMILAPLFLPPFVSVIGLKSFLGRFGTVNLLALQFGLIREPIDFFKPGKPYGIIVLQMIHLYPLVYLSLRSAFEKIPFELVEAARMCGASKLKTWLRVLLPLLRPALVSGALLSLIGSITDVGTPLLFEYRRSIAVQIFNTLLELPTYSAGYVSVIAIAVLVASVFAVNARFERKLFVAGDAKQGKKWPTERVRTVPSIFIICSVIAVIMVGVLPHLALFLVAIGQKWFLTPLPTSYSLEGFFAVIQHPLTKQSFLYSVGLSVAAAIIVTILTYSIARTTIQKKSSRLTTYSTNILLYVALLPLAIPGLVTAFGMVVGFGGTVFDPKNNPTILLIAAYSLRKIPYGIKLFQSSFAQVSIALEEAAKVSGASGYQIFWKILFPLHKPAIVSVAVITILASLMEVSSSLLLPLDEKFFPIAKTLYALQGRPDGANVAAAFSILVMITTILGFFLVGKWQNKSVAALLKGEL